MMDTVLPYKAVPTLDEQSARAPAKRKNVEPQVRVRLDLWRRALTARPQIGRPRGRVVIDLNADSDDAVEKARPPSSSLSACSNSKTTSPRLHPPSLVRPQPSFHRALRFPFPVSSTLTSLAQQTAAGGHFPPPPFTPPPFATTSATDPLSSVAAPTVRHCSLPLSRSSMLTLLDRTGSCNVSGRGECPSLDYV